ncbi:50S ribosomal protein L3 [Natranaerobius thermophilus]|uniref:Large ribosomal subunit protein uL3 n=1 Tax=Natranaerobius thermophilus (strain ATCC BAA-1301 / DSM 18059 / JW/NM-WN-LF) TaxID=457570 RepID=RL3_NATTJ|nr:50S ribosomal protein L3 [Natranaerobius thermophilus]B2A4D9.1 RecName: Full=Large ribosomal subunit protein uL3; AltName: Full=50S ribosomal protein L3 [Natranaerobius thermophilus JW/NM-WN-LF]ACB83793.1 LSU ribosomal protein L3P [Natranaerobius thermophilus JW/NM-WN-LF]
MKKAILGKKVGMTQIFSEEGEVMPVTVVKAGPCSVVQKKVEDTDGYNAVQIGFEDKKENKTKKPEKGHFEKAGVNPKKHLTEFELESMENLEVGQELTVEQFEVGDQIDVTGTSKSKGFQGTIKRFKHSTGPKTHGSRFYRAPGSLGSMDISRVFKGQTLPGRMGGNTVTVQRLEVVDVDKENNLLLVKGAVPGPKKGLLKIVDSVKAKS